MPNLNFNIFNIIILAGVIQGIIFGFFHIVPKNKQAIGNLYIALTVISLSLNNLQYWFSDSNLDQYISLLSYFHIPFELLITPSFFLFVRSYLNYRTTLRSKYLLASPFIISGILHFLVTLDFFLFDNVFLNLKIRTAFFIAEEYFSFMFSLFLIAIIIRDLRLYERKNNIYPTNIVIAKTKWLKQILCIGLIICSFWIFIIFYMSSNNFGYHLYYPLWISISFLIYWISYAASLNYALQEELKKLKHDFITANLNKTLPTKRKKQLTDSKNIFLEFEILINDLYSDPYISIENVSKQLNVSSNYLSQLINQNNISFNTYINKLRIEKSKHMLIDKSFSKYTITAIGLESGFNSKASFYRAFKKYTGTSPIDFRNSLKE